jgi:diguanylate cyclase (GGDEF)-like protein
LTGLWNRSRFRSLGRAAFRAGEPAAIAVVDVVEFHKLNEVYGHLTADAVLVEVAAALATTRRRDRRAGGRTVRRSTNCCCVRRAEAAGEN